MTQFERNFEYAKLDVQEAILDAIEYVTDNTTQEHIRITNDNIA